MRERRQGASASGSARKSSRGAPKKTDTRRDAAIRRAIRSDRDAAPELDSTWFDRAKLVIPEPKQAVSIRLDRDVMDWFRRKGRGYQTRINAVLRSYVEAHKNR